MQSSTGPTMKTEGDERQGALPLKPYVAGARTAYIIVAWILAASIAVQVFLAGMGVFMSPIYFQSHAAFVHLFGELPLLMLILAFAGRLSTGLRWATAGLWGLIAVQYATADIRYSGETWALVVASLHPVTAMGLFWAAIATLKKARREAARR